VITAALFENMCDFICRLCRAEPIFAPQLADSC